jgi:hypothetical protein
MIDVAFQRTLFRRSLPEWIRLMKRSPVFRHPLYAVASLVDPLEPDRPFLRQGPLPEIEQDWQFTRDAVPDYIRLSVGRAARERAIADFTREYNASDPAQRWKSIEEAIKFRDDEDDPFSGPPELYCFLLVSAELTGSIPIAYGGPRDRVLTNRMLRRWFFDERAELLHGQPAMARAKALLRENQCAY